ncbi:MAG: flagellin [Pseudohongiellaceae bacterium]|jgi:flagellar hook-associated protein 3 FlgL
MKVATNQYFNMLTRYMGDQQGKIAELQAKLATGDNMVKPSAEPDLAAQSLQLRSTIKRQETFLQNLTALDSRLQQQETAISGMEKMLVRMQELAVRAANDTYSALDREAIAVEVRGYRDEILALANSRDGNGNYYFSGIKSTTRPFVENQSGAVDYRGDETRIEIDVDEGNRLTINIDGKTLLPDIVRSSDAGPEKVATFDVLDDFANALSASDGDGIQQAITDLDMVASNLQQLMVDIGLRRTVVEAKQEIIEEKKLVVESILSNARDLDYNTAVSQLSAEMLALEAAQSTVAKVTQLSLFNYLR